MTMDVGVMAAGHGRLERSYSIRIRLSPAPAIGVPRMRVDEPPLFTVACESIERSGTGGTTLVSVKMLPRCKESV